VKGCKGVVPGAIPYLGDTGLVVIRSFAVFH
jgi:hypothetical protein